MIYKLSQFSPQWNCSAKQIERKRQTLGYKSSKGEKKIPTVPQLHLFKTNLFSSPSPAKCLYQVTAASTLPPAICCHLLTPIPKYFTTLLIALQTAWHLAQLGIFQLKFTVNNLTVCDNLENIWTASLENLAGSHPEGFSPVSSFLSWQTQRRWIARAPFWGPAPTFS